MTATMTFFLAADWRKFLEWRTNMHAWSLTRYTRSSSLLLVPGTHMTLRWTCTTTYVVHCTTGSHNSWDEWYKRAVASLFLSCLDRAKLRLSTRFSYGSFYGSMWNFTNCWKLYHRFRSRHASTTMMKAITSPANDYNGAAECNPSKPRTRRIHYFFVLHQEEKSNAPTPDKKIPCFWLPEEGYTDVGQTVQDSEKRLITVDLYHSLTILQISAILVQSTRRHYATINQEKQKKWSLLHPTESLASNQARLSFDLGDADQSRKKYKQSVVEDSMVGCKK